MDLIGWIVAPVILGLVYERAAPISEWLIVLTVRAYPSDQRHELVEEWIADNRNTRGNTWKLVHAAGILIGMGIPRLFANAEITNTKVLDRRVYEQVLLNVQAMLFVVSGRMPLFTAVLAAIGIGMAVALLGILPMMLGLPLSLLISLAAIAWFVRRVWQAKSKGRDPE